MMQERENRTSRGWGEEDKDEEMQGEEGRASTKSHFFEPIMGKTKKMKRKLDSLEKARTRSAS